MALFKIIVIPSNIYLICPLQTKINAKIHTMEDMYIIITQMNCEHVNKSMYVTNPCTHEFKQVPKIFHSNTLITVFN